jgi:hypothetical protein
MWSQSTLRRLLVAIGFVQIAIIATAIGYGAKVGEPGISFLHPRSRVVIMTPQGASILLQARVIPHPDNRWVSLAWDGIGCMGSWARSLDGDDEYALQPPEAITVRLDATGTCHFVGVVLGKDGKPRASAFFDLEATSPAPVTVRADPPPRE